MVPRRFRLLWKCPQPVAHCCTWWYSVPLCGHAGVLRWCFPESANRMSKLLMLANQKERQYESSKCSILHRVTAQTYGLDLKTTSRPDDRCHSPTTQTMDWGWQQSIHLGTSPGTVIGSIGSVDRSWSAAATSKNATTVKTQSQSEANSGLGDPCSVLLIVLVACCRPRQLELILPIDRNCCSCIYEKIQIASSISAVVGSRSRQEATTLTL